MTQRRSRWHGESQMRELSLKPRRRPMAISMSRRSNTVYSRICSRTPRPATVLSGSDERITVKIRIKVSFAVELINTRSFRRTSETGGALPLFESREPSHDRRSRSRDEHADRRRPFKFSDDEPFLRQTGPIIVYQARHCETDRHVGVRVRWADPFFSPSQRLFFRELKIFAANRHPTIQWLLGFSLVWDWGGGRSLVTSAVKWLSLWKILESERSGGPLLR
jgi:hypothetical protein